MILRILCAFMVLAACCFAADVTGKWTGEFDTQIGPQKYTYELTAAGAKLTGRAKGGVAGSANDVEIKEGKIDGDRISFVEMFRFEDNDIRIEYSGQIIGDQIKFTRKVADFATEEFVARRAK